MNVEKSNVEKSKEIAINITKESWKRFSQALLNFYLFLSQMLKLAEERQKTYKVQEQQQQRIRIAMYYQSDIQNSLAYILTGQRIVPYLYPILSPVDITSFPFSYVNNHLICYFGLLKSQNSRIPESQLKIIPNRINSLIRAKRCQKANEYNSLDDYGKEIFKNTWPSIFRGFSVVSCRDNFSDIIIGVELN